jgi:endonuclease/exonuclease/phosphatase family metal-dependent hydrolase
VNGTALATWHAHTWRPGFNSEVALVRKTTVGVLLALVVALVLVVLVYRSRHREEGVPVATGVDTYVRLQQPETLSYEELLVLGTTDTLSGTVGDRLHALTTTPFISNEAYYRGATPHRPILTQLGRSLRLVAWNIERGLELDGIKLLFTNADEFLRQADRKDGKVDLAEIRQAIGVLTSADVLVLNEVDWGLKRTGYRAVVEELGVALNMNWAFGVEFVEVDPITLGTETLPEIEDPEERRQLLAEIHVDKARLTVLHGTVVLSRYPIREALLKPFQTVGYDWYAGEKKGLDILEKGQRTGAQAAFLEKATRQVRRGGRTALIVTLDVPELQEQRLSVAATHRECNAAPESRRQQMEALLARIHDIPNPVVVAGDLNTTGGDSSPTSVKREILQRLGSASFWANRGIKYATGFGVLYEGVRGSLNVVKNEDDPTARDIPLIGSNPEAELFHVLEEFRFQDGRAFDFRGNEERTINETEGTLGNSNQRDGKGFATTFEFERNLGVVGKLKLDWILVKSYATDPRDDEEPYRFAPHFARRLDLVNYALPTRLSDHDPISVDLPFAEPASLETVRGQ